MILQIFGGSGRWSAAWRRQRRRHGIDAFEWDLRWGDSMDLTTRKAWSLLRGWLQSGLIAAVWLSPPRGSWSAYLRTEECPMGLEGLSPREKEKVRVGNLLMHRSATILDLCRKLTLPAALESPATSRIWLPRRMVAACKHTRASKVDFCRYAPLEEADSGSLRACGP